MGDDGMQMVSDREALQEPIKSGKLSTI